LLWLPSTRLLAALTARDATLVMRCALVSRDLVQRRGAAEDAVEIALRRAVGHRPRERVVHRLAVAGVERDAVVAHGGGDALAELGHGEAARLHGRRRAAAVEGVVEVAALGIED